MNFLKRLYLKLCPKYRRLDFKVVPYGTADMMIRKNSTHLDEREHWHIAKEEDYNCFIGYVCLERKERIR